MKRPGRSTALFLPLLAALALGAPAFAAGGIPNDLSLFFKSPGKLETRTVRYQGVDLKERLDPRFKAPVFIYDIPATLPLDALLRDLVLTPRGFDGRFSLRRDPAAADARTATYALHAGDVQVDEAWVKIEPAEAGFVALAVKLPPRNDLGDEPWTNVAYLQDGLARYTKERVGTSLRLRFEAEDAPPVEVTVEPLTPVQDPDATIEKISLPRGTFPDQIKIAADGGVTTKVWFTQPSDNLLTSYDPATKEFQHVTVGSLPDGLHLDRAGRLWFGEYGNAKLGFYDPATSTHKQYAPDYEGSTPAIPYEDAQGIIWITDHQANKIGRFDPATETFAHYAVPSANAWAVDLVQTSDTSKLWVTECYANKLGRIDVESFAFDEVALPTSSCPAFFVPSGTDLYVSLWSTGSFLRLDTATGAVTEYKVEGATGFGPIDRMPDGTIVLGGLHDGRVYRFDPATKELSFIPGVGRLKDGIKAAPDGTTWVTEMGPYIYQVTW